MEFSAFIEKIQREAHFAYAEQAIAAARATLHTLAERLTSRDALFVASELAGPAASYLLSPPRSSGEVFSHAEFFRRIAAREGVHLDAAMRHAGVVLHAIYEQLSPRARERVMRALPREFGGLFEDAQAAN